MKLSELTEAQKKEFTEQFYYVADSRLKDFNTPTPWGRPWLWCDYESKDAESPAMLATEFWIDHQDEIVELIDQDEKEYNDWYTENEKQMREEYEKLNKS